MTFPVRFVLVETSHPGNIGSCARAMKTMGYEELVLVNPAEFPSGEARAMASGAQDVLAGARVVATLAEAVADCGLVIGASARHRRLGCPELAPRECATALQDKRRQAPVAILFGPERSGLDNEALDLCHALVYIPANPDYSSLNIAMALQIIAWELRQTEPFATLPVEAESPPASVSEMELFYDHLERVLLGSGFLNPQNPRQLMRRLRRLYNRTQLDSNEVNIMRGILSTLAPGSGPRPRGED